MKKLLYFDLEHGKRTLGSRQDIEKMLGYPTLEPSSYKEFQKIVKQLYVPKTVEETVNIGGIKVKQSRKVVEPKAEIDGIIVDTVSELSKKYMRSLMGTENKMQLQDWSKLKNTLDNLLDMLTMLPGILICNCHSKIQTMGDGENKIIPYIDGSTKEDISKWFDFVFYTATIKDGKDRKYVWITKRDEKYDHAKDRSDLLPEQMPQDFDEVIKATQAKGFENCRILIIGSPGSGKTYSLASLTQPKPDDKPNVAKEEFINKGENDG